LRPGVSEREYIVAARVVMIIMMISASVLATGITDITPWVMFINAAMITPALPLSWLRWFWWRFNIWGELFGLVISVPLASLIWFGLGASAWPFWQPIILLPGIGLVGSVIVTLLTPPESKETLRAFYLKVRPPGYWAPLRSTLAAEGLIDLAQQRREFKWDWSAAVCGIVFCFSITYTYFLSVVLNWAWAAFFAMLAVVFGFAFFVCWLRSARISLFSEGNVPGPASAPAVTA